MWHWLYYEVIIGPWVEWDHVSGNMHALLKRFWNLGLWKATLMNSEPKKSILKWNKNIYNNIYNNQFIIMFCGERYCVWGRSFSPPHPVDKTLYILFSYIVSQYQKPYGACLIPMHVKWNQLYGHSELSHWIISTSSPLHEAIDASSSKIESQLSCWDEFCKQCVRHSGSNKEGVKCFD